MKKLSEFTMYASYSQFMVFDDAVRRPGLKWSKDRIEQGFVRSDSSVSFGIPNEYGKAVVSTYFGNNALDLTSFDRAIEVPFSIQSGRVIVCGPDEVPADPLQSLDLPCGDYRLLVAIKFIGEHEMTISIVISNEKIERSRILVADKYMNPHKTLIETGVPA